jgi:hypothetical protein
MGLATVSKNKKNFWTKNAENFQNVFNFFFNFLNSKIKIQAQIFPKIDRKMIIISWKMSILAKLTIKSIKNELTYYFR